MDNISNKNNDTELIEEELERALVYLGYQITKYEKGHLLFEKIERELIILRQKKNTNSIEDRVKNLINKNNELTKLLGVA